LLIDENKKIIIDILQENTNLFTWTKINMANIRSQSHHLQTLSLQRSKINIPKDEKVGKEISVAIKEKVEKL